MRDAIIVGAGISGLTLAHSLEQAGKSVLLLESGESAGGVLSTKRVGDFLLELGPNSILAKAGFREFVDSLGLSEELCPTLPSAKNRYIAASNGKAANQLHCMPKTPSAILKTPLISNPGKLRILCEFFQGRLGEQAGGDLDVRSFIAKKFGPEFAQKIADPLLAGIWAADIGKLSCRTALPKLWQIERNHSSVLRFGLKKLFNKNSIAKPELLSFKRGLSQMTETLAERISPESIAYRSEATEISLEKDKAIVSFKNADHSKLQTERAKAVVITSPAWTSAGLIRDLDSELSTRIQAIPYAPLGVLHLAYEKKKVVHKLDGFGFLVQNPKPIGLLGAIFNSSLFANRAPKEHHLLTCFVGGAKFPQLANLEDEQVALLTREVSQIINSSTEPEVLCKKFWPKAIPNYPVGHHLLQESVEKFEGKLSPSEILVKLE